jgi:hypothetical protein
VQSIRVGKKRQLVNRHNNYGLTKLTQVKRSGISARPKLKQKQGLVCDITWAIACMSLSELPSHQPQLFK